MKHNLGAKNRQYACEMSREQAAKSNDVISLTEMNWGNTKHIKEGRGQTQNHNV